MIRMLLALCVVPLALEAKTLVFTTAFNRPDFIEIQHRMFKKFLQDDYEFIIISDANTQDMQTQIANKGNQLGLKVFQVPQEIHANGYLPRQSGDNYQNPNVRHCNSVQWAWDHVFANHDGPVMVIDSDMFLIRPYSIANQLKDAHLAGVFWGTQDSETGEPYSYLWLALILFNNPLLPEKETLCFNCGALPGTHAICDSGGWTNLYLRKFQGQLNVHPLSYMQGHQFYCPYRYGPRQNLDHVSQEDIIHDLRKRNFTENEIWLALQKPYTIELLDDNHFLHYRAGTNYENYSDQFLMDKDHILNEFFNKILEE